MAFLNFLSSIHSLRSALLPFKLAIRMENKSDINNDNSNQSGPISTSEFLDFLKLACRVHESIILKDEGAKALDYNALAKNELVNALVNSKSGQSPKSNATDDGGSNDKNGEFLLEINERIFKFYLYKIPNFFD